MHPRVRNIAPKGQKYCTLEKIQFLFSYLQAYQQTRINSHFFEYRAARLFEYNLVIFFLKYFKYFKYFNMRRRPMPEAGATATFLKRPIVI